MPHTLRTSSDMDNVSNCVDVQFLLLVVLNLVVLLVVAVVVVHLQVHPHMVPLLQLLLLLHRHQFPFLLQPPHEWARAERPGMGMDDHQSTPEHFNVTTELAPVCGQFVLTLVKCLYSASIGRWDLPLNGQHDGTFSHKAEYIVW